MEVSGVFVCSCIAAGKGRKKKIKIFSFDPDGRTAGACQKRVQLELEDSEVTTEMTGKGQQNEKEKFLSCIRLLCCQIRRSQLENTKTSESRKRKRRKKFFLSVVYNSPLILQIGFLITQQTQRKCQLLISGGRRRFSQKVLIPTCLLRRSLLQVG